MEIEGSTITIDAIGATENIVNAIHDNGGKLVLQVKKNCSELYTELIRLFVGLSEDRENDLEEFQYKYGSHYSEAKTTEKNRARYTKSIFNNLANTRSIKQAIKHDLRNIEVLKKDGLYSARYYDKQGKRKEKYLETLPEAKNWLVDTKYEEWSVPSLHLQSMPERRFV